MEIKNLYDRQEKDKVLARLAMITPSSKRLWGKMDAAQMLAHCQAPIKMALTDKPVPRKLIGILLGWTVKKKLYNDVAWKPGLPTSPDFIIKDQRNFEQEKVKLIQLIEAFYEAGPDGSGKFPHPFFGTFTKEQWGKSLWKHMDHHLRQFGA